MKRAPPREAPRPAEGGRWVAIDRDGSQRRAKARKGVQRPARPRDGGSLARIATCETPSVLPMPLPEYIDVNHSNILKNIRMTPSCMPRAVTNQRRIGHVRKRPGQGDRPRPAERWRRLLICADRTARNRLPAIWPTGRPGPNHSNILKNVGMTFRLRYHLSAALYCHLDTDRGERNHGSAAA